MNNDIYLKPPGTELIKLFDFLETDQTLELAVTQEHRFVFYFWNKWLKAIKDDNNVPSLVSFDWHKDLQYPSQKDRESLNKLDLNSYKCVSNFSWDILRKHNDSHILSAAYLNLIGDIYVLCKQKTSVVKEIIDKFGNIHKVNCYDNEEELINVLIKSKINSLFFDLDLDFFIKENKDKTVDIEKERIIKLMNPNSYLVQWILARTKGITIAKEPKHCGGILNSDKIFSLVCKTLFPNIQI